MTNKKEKQEQVHAKEMEKIKNTNDWEITQAKGSVNSLKDEYWTIIFSIPLILCFIPSMTEYVDAGFKVIAGTPDWYKTCVLTLVGASVGVRKLTNIISASKNK